MNINPDIFREYDIRGIVDEDVSEEFAYLLGRAYAQLAKQEQKDNIAIGYDCRLSSESYARSLAKGMADEGISSFITGMGPTPQLYFAIFSKEAGGGIQVTGSHNPSNMNGFKICLGTKTLRGTQIKELYNIMCSLPDVDESVSKGETHDIPFREEYFSMLVDKCKGRMGDRKLKAVVDAGNGVGGMVGPDLLRTLGVEVIELYCEPDGNFPNHHPDPSELENLEDLVHAIKEHNADFGIGWDGDADRIGVVDEKGEIIFGDMLVLIYGREILKSRPDATIIGDVKCSSRLFDDLKKKGAKPIMWKTGHSLIKEKLRETNAEMAGEMSGHMFFNDIFFGFDDAIYATARFAEIVSKTDLPVSELLADLPPAVSTPEIRVDCPESMKFKIPEEAKTAFSEFEVDTTDGARVTFEEGCWGLVRASNTQPIIVMRFEATTEEKLTKYQELMTARIEKIKESLS